MGQYLQQALLVLDEVLQEPEGVTQRAIRMFFGEGALPTRGARFTHGPKEASDFRKSRFIR